MNTYKLKLKRTAYGEAIVEANDPAEARKLFEEGKEKDFEDFSENYPVEWRVEAVDIMNPESEEWEELEEGEYPACDHSFIDTDNEGFYGEEVCRKCGTRRKK